jgi:hypothetical protein
LKHDRAFKVLPTSVYSRYFIFLLSLSLSLSLSVPPLQFMVERWLKDYVDV